MERNTGANTLIPLILLIMLLTMLMMPMASMAGERTSGASPTGSEKEAVPGPRGFDDPLLSEPWPMFGRDVYHSNVAPDVKDGLRSPYLKWDKGESVDSWGTTIGDLSPNVDGGTSGSGHLGVVYADGGFINIVNGRTGQYMWRMNADLLSNATVGDLVRCAVALGDFNSNSRMDIIFTVENSIESQYIYMVEPVISYNGTAYSWNSSSYDPTEIMWRHHLNGRTINSSPTLFDHDGDGKLEVFIGVSRAAFDSYLTSFNVEDGSQADFNLTLSGNLVSSPVFSRSGSSVRGYAVTYNSTTVSYNIYSFLDGSEGASLNIPTSLSIPSMVLLPSPVLGEFDNTITGKEVVFTFPFVNTNDGRMVAFDKTLGTKLWDRNFTSRGQTHCTPAVWDVNGDSIEDILMSSKETTNFYIHLQAISGTDGKDIWQVTRASSVVNPALGSPLVSDLNSDGTKDVVFSSVGAIYAFNASSGSYLWNFTISGHAFDTCPAACDLDGDGFLDIATDGLAITHKIIDLTLSRDNITFDTALMEGQTTTISALIENHGHVSATAVKVSFLDDGAFIGNTTVSSVAITHEATMQWTPSTGGQHNITVIIDPDNTIVEVDESNNNATKQVNVTEVYPDLIIAGLGYFRADGTRVDNVATHLVAGQRAVVTARVLNQGLDISTPFWVQFVLDSVTIGTGYVDSTLPVNSGVNVSVNWTVDPLYASQTKGLVVTADHNDTVKESDETNDQTSVSLQFLDPTNPANSPYALSGRIYMPDRVTYVPNASLTFTDMRTNQKITSASDGDGYYYMDISNVQGGYDEGDMIKVFTRGTGAFVNSTIISVYSEDKGRVMDIVLHEEDVYTFTAVLDANAKGIPPGGSVQYLIDVQNTGNRQNTIDISTGAVYDKDTGYILDNWTVELESSSTTLIMNGKDSIGMTIHAPAASTSAPAGQRVRVVVILRSANDPDQETDLECITTVQSLFSASIQTLNGAIEQVNPQFTSRANFSLRLTNDGNRNGTFDLNLTGSAIFRTELPSIIILPAGGEKDLTLVVNISSDIPPGTYGFIINVTSHDGTLDGVGIALTLNIVLPDLRVELSLSPLEPEPRKNANLSIKVHNQGLADSPFYILGIYEPFLGEQVVTSNESVGKGSYETYNYMFVMPAAVSQLEFRVTVDPSDDIMELDENNNIAYLNTSGTGDLAFSGPLRVSPPLSPGKLVTLSVDVRNAGGVNITRTDVEVEFLYIDPSTGSEQMISSAYIGPIPSGSSLNASVEWLVPSISGVRNFTIVVRIDPKEYIPETSEDNNELSLSLDVEQGDPGTDGGGFLSAIPTMWWIVIVSTVILVLLVIGYFYYLKSSSPGEEDGKGPGDDDGGKGVKPGKAATDAEDTGDGEVKIVPDTGDEDLMPEEDVVLDEEIPPEFAEDLPDSFDDADGESAPSRKEEPANDEGDDYHDEEVLDMELTDEDDEVEEAILVAPIED